MALAAPSVGAVDGSCEAVTSLVAGTPYIVRLPEGEQIEDITDPLFEGVEINTTPNDVVVDGGTFVGTYTRVVWPAGTKNVLFLQNNKFYYPEEEAWVNPFRGYIQLSQEVPSAVGAKAKIIFDLGDGEATGIKSFGNSPKANSWYTINGVKLNSAPAAKGVYIHNGRKVVIK